MNSSITTPLFKLISPFAMSCTICFSQNVDFDRLGKEKWLRYKGGIAANMVLYDGTSKRQELTYYLNGNLNFNLAGLYNIPLSFTYSNQDFAFPNPFKFNRLSLSPSYKWVTLHVGDVGMRFSPYTISGHQFTGGGFELVPEGKFQISALYGRFLKATEYNAEAPTTITTYKRMGYGVKTAYDLKFLKLGLILFKAIDDETSLKNPFPIELGVSPKENAVLSMESEILLLQKAQIRLEYAVSGVTADTRLTAVPTTKGILSFLLNENISTRYYNAFNASFNYPTNNGTLGIGYERIDPGYNTLGAYYFNNDLENITANASRTLFNSKLNLAINAGLQKDNLDNAKIADQQRIVSSINLSYTASERLGIIAVYSNFQSYTNIRDQFDYINQLGDFDNIDTLNYRQISQHANLNLNYTLKETKQNHYNTSLNLVYQNSDNRQEGKTMEGDNIAFYNGTASFSLGYPHRNINITLAANTSYNSTPPTDHNLTIGPTLVVKKLFFEKRLRANLSTSYNSSHTKMGRQSAFYNFRLGSNYSLLKKHHLNLNFLVLFRKSALNINRDLTFTLGYSYTFNNFKLEFLNRERNPKDHSPIENTLSFRYRNVFYSGTIPELNQQFSQILQSTQFADIPSFKTEELKILLALLKERRKEVEYKESALIFLKALYGYHDFKNLFEHSLFNVISNIRADMQRIDFKLEKRYVTSKVELDEFRITENPDNRRTPEALGGKYGKSVADYKEREQKLFGHRWMEKEFSRYESIEDIEKPFGHLKEFKDQIATRAYRHYEENKDLQELEEFLEIRIIDYYYRRSINNIDPDILELRYINKN